MLRFLRVKKLLYITKATKIIRETFQYVKIVGYMLSVTEDMKTGNIFMGKKKENNFVLELVVYSFKKGDKLIWTHKVMEGLQKKNLEKRRFF